MRMKFNKSKQFVLVSAVSLMLASLVTACGSNTVDFVFVTSSKSSGTSNYDSGEINVYKVDKGSGLLKQLPSSPFLSQGRNPVASVASSTYNALYVVNRDDNAIVQFLIGNDGKLYPENTVNPPGIYPMGVTISGANLFVIETYKPKATCSVLAPCNGAIAAYPIQSAVTSGSTTQVAGKLGTVVSQGSLTYVELTPAISGGIIQPTGLVASGSNVFVSAYDTVNSVGYVYTFSNASGVLTQTSVTVAGTHPSALAADDAGSYLYVADYTDSKVRSYAISSGKLTLNATATAGSNPSAIAIDSTHSYAFVTNATDSTISCFKITSGALEQTATAATDSKPVAIVIDPLMHDFVYTANYLNSDVSGFVTLTSGSTAGTLTSAMNSPFSSNPQPTSITAVPYPQSASK